MISSSRQPRTARLQETVLLAVGFGCLIAYSRMLSLGFVGYLGQGFMASTDPHYLVRTVAGIVVLAGCAAAGRFGVTVANPRSFMAATVVMTSSTIVFALDESGMLGLPVAVVSGASNALVMYAWMLLLSRCAIRQIVEATLGGLVLSGAIVMGAPALGTETCLAIAVIAAFCSGAFALACDPYLVSCAADGPLTRTEARRVPWLSVALLLSCGALSAMLYGIAQRRLLLVSDSANYAVFGVFAVLVLVCTVALIIRSRRWGHFVWVPSFAVFVCAILFSCFSTDGSLQVALGFMLASVFCLRFLPWMVLPALFSQAGVPRAFPLGVLLVLMSGSLSARLGEAVGASLPPSVQVLSSVACIVAVILAVLLAVGFMLDRSFGTALAPDGAPAVPAEPNGALASAASAAPGTAAAPTEPTSTDSAAPAESPPAGPAAPTEPAPAAPPAAPAEPAPAAFAPSSEPPASADSPAEQLRLRLARIAEAQSLTAREEEVAHLTAQGFSCAYIADKLVVSNSTVRYHQQNAYRKLEVHSRNELIEFVNAVSLEDKNDCGGQS